MDRRTLLRTVGLSTVAVGIGGALSACDTGETSDPNDAAGPLNLPTFKDPGVAAADLVSKHPDGLPGFFKYPTTPVRMYGQPVVEGVGLTALTYSFSPVVPGLDKNEMWQKINDTLGAKVDIIYTPDADYQSRFATVIAGGDIPDLVAVRPPIQQLPAMLKATFADLSDFLGGDAILEYPSLAAIPTAAWRKTVVQGRIWGLPVPRPPIGATFFVRKDLLDQRGLPSQPKDFAEFARVMRELTDKRESRYACASFDGFVEFVAGTYGLAGPWSEQGGKFTHWAETAQYEQALADVRALVDEGVFHPDGLGSVNTQRNEWFTNGSVPMILAGWGGWPSFVNWGKAIPGHKVDAIIPFGHDGGDGARHGRVSADGFTALKRAAPERIKQVLRVADWLAAPYGTQDYLTRKFGIEGVTYDLKGTDPVSNKRGAELRLVPFSYLTDCMGPIYQANDAEVVRARFEYQEKVLPMVGQEATDGLYSATESAQGAQLKKLLADAQVDILARRQPVSSWKAVVAQWRDRGGDKIRKDYEEAFGS